MSIFIVQTLLLLLVTFGFGYFFGRAIKDILCRQKLQPVVNTSSDNIHAGYTRTADRLAARDID
ncbi:MAG TPA: hypothetical protein ENI84_00715 [Thiothrix sp.]|nr:hypothetical protein [Thiothrix sp.]